MVRSAPSVVMLTSVTPPSMRWYRARSNNRPVRSVACDHGQVAVAAVTSSNTGLPSIEQVASRNIIVWCCVWSKFFVLL